MSASLVGSEMCIRDSPSPRPPAAIARASLAVAGSGAELRVCVCAEGGARASAELAGCSGILP
eukprot:9372217-Alexandrium_andersonii.AAC.1